MLNLFKLFLFTSPGFLYESGLESSCIFETALSRVSEVHGLMVPLQFFSPVGVLSVFQRYTV